MAPPPAPTTSTWYSRRPFIEQSCQATYTPLRGLGYKVVGDNNVLEYPFHGTAKGAQNEGSTVRTWICYNFEQFPLLLKALEAETRDR